MLRPVAILIKIRFINKEISITYRDLHKTLTQEQNIKIEAEAWFFCAFAYRKLAYLFGGVPLVLEEATVPRYGYVRATKQEVLEQYILDATFAAENLVSITAPQDGYYISIGAFLWCVYPLKKLHRIIFSFNA